MFDVVAKEMFHYTILSALNESTSKNGSKIVFQGGTALSMIYGSGRHSEDLDFSAKNMNLDFVEDFKRILNNNMKRTYGYDVEIKDPDLTSKNIVRAYAIKVIIPEQKRKIMVKIELADIKSYDNSLKFVKNKYDENANRILIWTESEKELLADKVIALGARNYFKARDIWDIKFLIDIGVKLDIEMVHNKINDYNILDFKDKLQNRLNTINTDENRKLFTVEMSRFVDPDRLIMLKDDRAISSFMDSSIEIIKETMFKMNEEYRNM